MSVFWILAIVAVVLVAFSGIFAFRGAARTGCGILKILFFVFIIFLFVMIIFAFIRQF